MTNTSMTSREAFEEYAKTNKRIAHLLNWLEDYNCYEKLQAQTAWEAWQASQAQQAQTIAELVEAVDNLRKVKGRHNTEIACNRLYALADKVKGK